MIAFATAVVDPVAYTRFARPGIDAAAEPGAEVLAYAALGTAPRNANLLLDEAARLQDLEALVLVDERVELTDAGLCATLRSAFRDPDVAVVGWMGASGVRTIAWWEGRISCGPVRHRYHDHGGGELAACAWTRVEPPPADVDAVDGRLMALSPWAVRHLRFDEELHLGFGYDIDFCFRARAEGRRVVTAPIAAVHHDKLELLSDEMLWAEAHIRFAEKWDEAGDETDWRARARRAEAERDAARTRVYSAKSIAEARIARREAQLAQMTATRSWRLTAPLRALNHRLRRS